MRFALPQRSIADYTAQPQNNYQLLRFLAALMVIFSHSYALSSPGMGDILRRSLKFIDFGTLGVDIFFVISGFLVTASYLHRADLADYLKCRVLRITPGLLVCVALTALVLGPLVTSLEPGAYFAARRVYGYILVNLSLYKTAYLLPGVFHGLPFRDAVNGSLWTLPAEFRLYLLIGVLGVVGLLSRQRWYLWVVLGLAAVVLLMPELHTTLIPTNPQVRPLYLFFFTGSALRVYAHRVPLNGIILGVLAMASLALCRTPALPWLLAVTLVYAVFWVAYVPNLHWFNRLGDYSYGLYIYAFPVGQTLVQYLGPLQPLQLFAAASVATLVCAVLSWHLVEQPALRLKRVRFRENIRRLLRGRSAADTIK